MNTVAVIENEQNQIQNTSQFAKNVQFLCDANLLAWKFYRSQIERMVSYENPWTVVSKKNIRAKDTLIQEQAEIINSINDQQNNKEQLLSEKDREISTLNIELSILEQDNHTYINKIQELKNQIQSKTDELSVKNAEIESLKSETAILNASHKKELENQKSELSSKHKEELEKELSFLRNELNSMKNHHQDQINKKEKEHQESLKNQSLLFQKEMDAIQKNHDEELKTAKAQLSTIVSNEIEKKEAQKKVTKPASKDAKSTPKTTRKRNAVKKNETEE